MGLNLTKKEKNNMYKTKERGSVGLIGLAIVTLLTVVALFSMFEIVEETERAVVVRFGEVQGVLESGFHTINPFTTDLYRMDIKIVKSEVEATAASKDLQDVTTSVAVQYNLNPTKVGDIYKEYRTDVKRAVINPAIQDAIKAGTALFTAEELITNRIGVKDAIETSLRERLEEAHIHVSNVDIIDFSFSDSFNAAIERKVTAEQQAFEQENITKQEEEKKKQQILKAEAIAEKTRLEVQALEAGGDEIVEKIKAEAELERAKRWNGVLPVNVYGSAPLPFLDVDKG